MIRSIRLKDLTQNTKQLYLSSFPPQERLSENDLIKMINSNKPIHLIEYYDNQTYIGFMVCTLADGLLYIGYFAVSTNLRKQGYGGKILQSIRKEFHNYTIIFGIEEVTNIYDLHDPKTKRYMFYKKNGFFINNFNVKSKFGGIFNVISSKPVNRDEINKVIQKWVPGIFAIVDKQNYQ